MSSISAAKPASSYQSWSKYIAAVTLFLIIVGPVIHRELPEDIKDPKSGFGLALGFISLGIIYFAGYYSVRRAKLGLRLGRLESWLALHTYLGILCVLIVFIHADWRFRPGVATASLALLILVTISGAFGWLIYIRTPSRISREGEKIITPEETYYKMVIIQEEIDKLEKKLEKAGVEKRPGLETEILAQRAKLKDLEAELEKEFRQEAALGRWLFFHIPLSAALIVVASVHAFMIYYL